MSHTILCRPPVERFINAMHLSRLLPGLMISLALIALMIGRPGALAALGSFRVDTAIQNAEEPAFGESAEQSPAAAGLTPKMRAALAFVSRKYHVSAEALEPVFMAAQRAGKEARINPLLILAVISVESRFNPFAESIVGAQGLMQVMPQWHQDKIPEGMGRSALFDPETNVQVGALILAESIRREGGLIAGLQQFAGAIDDPDLTYANRVIAEKQEIEIAAARTRSAG